MNAANVTVKVHRGWGMRKTGASPLADLVNMAARLDETTASER